MLSQRRGLGRPNVVSAACIVLASLVLGPRAFAADIGSDGHLVFASDALATYGFESVSDAQLVGASWLTWGNNGQLAPTMVTTDDWTANSVSGADALEGASAVIVGGGKYQGLALFDTATFAGIASERVVVTMWGRAFGAEPVLEVHYSRNSSSAGPGNKANVLAIRTGRETSDGWVEYSSGPIDGSIWGTPIVSIVLTARYAADAGATSLLVDPNRAPGAVGAPNLLDPKGFAVIDAVEIRPADGVSMDSAVCTQATLDATCGPLGECIYGHCVDASTAWGAVPEALDHRKDLLARWAFNAQSLMGDRAASATAATSFAQVAATLSAATTPRAFYGKLNELVASLRDSHTTLGVPPGNNSTFYPLDYRDSGPLDVCFGVAQNDLSAGETVYAIFKTGGQGSLTETLKEGDVLTAIDGLAPADWLSALGPRVRENLPNDPAADPSETANILQSLIAIYASTVTFSRCDLVAGCAALPVIPVADPIYALIQNTGDYKSSNLFCTVRFHDAVSNPPPDHATIDTVVSETISGVTSVQFNGFDGFDPSANNSAAAWENAMSAAFTSTPSVIVDARNGHGGQYALGTWLFQLLRGTTEPYGGFAMPRGGYDVIDAMWLFDASWDACMFPDTAVDKCRWTGGQIAFANDAAPVGEGVKIAWVNSSDVSMNDIVPRWLQGRTNFRIFAPHSSNGAYGEISHVPSITSAWMPGSLQVLDTRFGATPAEARAAAWESGHGVVPDQIVVQKVSDILNDKDTLLDAAHAWLGQ